MFGKVLTETRYYIYARSPVRLINYLNSQGLKLTPQRRLILEVFLESEDHLASEELYEKVKKLNPAIGQATVYRTVKLLSDSGIAKNSILVMASPVTSLNTAANTTIISSARIAAKMLRS